MNIMLACSAGMSTSLVVSKMQEAAKQQGKTDYKIWAVDQTQIEDELGNFDVLLLGPQVRHIMRKVTKIVDGKAPIEVIDAVAYGTCNGEAVLKQAEALKERGGK
ncbi:PTS sugar transporter subunit IIB [[Eubacterium] hominis]|uniref:PTS sugar transporter subunit IIB n=1 Tax=[Eubacterium] hominis TaxID=2764325 RepID=UPI003A4DE962